MPNGALHLVRQVRVSRRLRVYNAQTVHERPRRPAHPPGERGLRLTGWNRENDMRSQKRVWVSGVETDVATREWMLWTAPSGRCPVRCLHPARTHYLSFNSHLSELCVGDTRDPSLWLEKLVVTARRRANSQHAYSKNQGH
ncbi:unnamed protein product [Pleuronectes platessa]|uniref:Uncharacterized protein n=1 Tax=Pleuronectes platessa TaxID=8262 RepID=A0A9N7UJT9_PLEPL|nr:unnamed protein product [Pleuronectes platessa]